MLFSKSKKAVDPALDTLFSSTLNSSRGNLPTKDRRQALSAVDEDSSSSSSHSLLSNEQDEQVEGEDVQDEDDDEADSRQLQKRKRKHVEVDIEGVYMQRLATEGKKEESERLRSKRQRADGSDHRSNSEVNRDDDKNLLSTPKHETLTEANPAIELEKATRTVFLANVSTDAIKSKTARKTLLDHLISFIPKLSSHEPPHKLESLRFRSVAFATSSVPKKAAFAKKELMDATTKSANAYAVYNSALAAREAVKHLNGKMVLERHLRVDGVAHPAKTDHRRCVFVGNLGFVDDESLIRAAEDGDDAKKPKKAKQPADVEEGLWRQFGNAGEVESVRVVRDKTTRIGKGFAYVQFIDPNSVEKALLFNGQKYPPLLSRPLRVTRAKSITKTASYNNQDQPKKKHTGTRIYNPRISSESQSLAGRAKKLLGGAGAAQIRKASTKFYRPKPTVIQAVDKQPEDFVFEGHRASGNQGKGTLKLGGSGKKHGKPRTRSSKRGTAFKAGGFKKRRD